MINVEILKTKGKRSDSDTERLKTYFDELKKIRNPIYLDKDDFEKILVWKLVTQYGRGRERRKVNSNDLIKQITQLALNISTEDEKYKTELRLTLLMSLRGVGMGVASAVLALIFPKEYAVIDFRVWKQIFDKDKRSFTLADYEEYIKKIREFAKELGWDPQEVDFAIWTYDQEKSL